MITWRGLTDDQRQAVQAVCAVVAPTKNLIVDCQHVPTGIHIQCHGEQATLTYGSTTDLMHGAALLCGQAQKTAQFDIQQQPRFEVMAAMLDVARNGVPTVAMVKQMIRRLASMGYNELWLYLEDLF